MVYKLLVVRQKGVIPFTFGLLLIHSPSKHNGHLLVDCTSAHFINSQWKILLYRYLKKLSLKLCMANCMFNPLPWKSVSLIKFVSEFWRNYLHLVYFGIQSAIFQIMMIFMITMKLWVILWEGIDAKNPAVWHYSSVFHIKSILSSRKNHSQVALWPSVRVTRKKCRDLISEKYQASKTPSFWRKSAFTH